MRQTLVALGVFGLLAAVSCGGTPASAGTTIVLKQTDAGKTFNLHGGDTVRVVLVDKSANCKTSPGSAAGCAAACLRALAPRRTAPNCRTPKTGTSTQTYCRTFGRMGAQQRAAGANMLAMLKRRHNSL